MTGTRGAGPPDWLLTGGALVQIPSGEPGMVWFDKTDYVAAQGGYTIEIKSWAGLAKTIAGAMNKLGS